MAAKTPEIDVRDLTGRNRIVNGAILVDQFNVGTSITPTTDLYIVDQFKAFLDQPSKLTFGQNLNAITPPSGFSNYLGIQVAAAYSPLAGELFMIGQPIEGINIADFSFGNAAAKTITASFWVRSSLTGTFAGSLKSATDRSYVFNYTIISANTWEYKQVTIAGDVTGAWLNNTGMGITLNLSLGCGSNFQTTPASWQTAANGFFSTSGSINLVSNAAATLYLTGVQLEIGNTATPFEYVSPERNLFQCYRYYFKNSVTSENTAMSPVEPVSAGNVASVSQTLTQHIALRTRMRANPTVRLWNYTAGTSGQWHFGLIGNTETSLAATAVFITRNGFSIQTTAIAAATHNTGYGGFAADARF